MIKREQKNLNAYEELIFDIAMTMVAKAFAHLNIAVELSTATPPNFPGAGAELRHAAGLMKHLHEVKHVLSENVLLFTGTCYYAVFLVWLSIAVVASTMALRHQRQAGQAAGSVPRDVRRAASLLRRSGTCCCFARVPFLGR
jgi:hypothetical protein